MVMRPPVGLEPVLFAVSLLLAVVLPLLLARPYKHFGYVVLCFVLLQILISSVAGDRPFLNGIVLDGSGRVRVVYHAGSNDKTAMAVLSADGRLVRRDELGPAAYSHNLFVDRSDNTFYREDDTIHRFDARGDPAWRAEAPFELLHLGGLSDGQLIGVGRTRENRLAWTVLTPAGQMAPMRTAAIMVDDDPGTRPVDVDQQGHIVVYDGSEVHKLGLDGTVLWSVAPPAMHLVSLEADAENGVYLAGVTNGGGSIVKISGTGAILFAQEVHMAGGMDLLRVVESGTDNVGNVYLSGSYDRKSIAHYSFIAKFSPAGKELWRKRISLSRRDLGAFVVDWTGNSYLAVDSSRSPYLQLLKFSPDGREIWRRKNLWIGLPWFIPLFLWFAISISKERRRFTAGARTGGALPDVRPPGLAIYAWLVLLGGVGFLIVSAQESRIEAFLPAAAVAAMGAATLAVGIATLCRKVWGLYGLIAFLAIMVAACCVNIVRTHDYTDIGQLVFAAFAVWYLTRREVRAFF